jgi:multicomponent Na+:H+ antiporter subunit G
MKEVLEALLLLIGAAFALLAAVGILRFPDVLSRMHAATKCSAFGISCIMLAAAVHFAELGVATRAIITITFIFATTPVAAHMIGRAAYFVGVPLWRGTVSDELKGHYDLHTHRLESNAPSTRSRTAPADQEKGGRVSS